MANIKISELNELETKHRDDLLPIVNSSNNETEKIKVENLINENVKLIAVSSTAPSECSLGDKYFNTTSKKIYTAIANNTWSSTGENAVEGILYIVFSEQSTYAYNGTTLVSVGSGNSGGGDSAPIGQVAIYAGSTAPDGWLICDGRAVSRTTYSRLFSTIGTTYGAGNGSTTFNLPNFKGRVPVGLDTSQTEFNSLNKRGGEKTHTLTVDEMPSHNHAIWTTTDVKCQAGNTYNLIASNTQYSNSGDTGGGQAHNNLQPYITVNYIIKAI